MSRSMAILAFVSALAFGGMGLASSGISAQESSPAVQHPFVGTWIVDTISASQNDSPEVSVVTPDGGVIGQGANRVAAGRWQAVDDHTADLTLVSVFEQAGIGSYIVVRGPHTVDATGNTWTCECTFTVVGADGKVLDSGSAPASGHRLPLQGTDLVGQAVMEVPVWVPVMDATPAS